VGVGTRVAPLVAIAFGGGVTWVTFVGLERVLLLLAVVVGCIVGLMAARHPRLRRRHGPPTSSSQIT
jgi:hypothetical protein